MAEECSMDLEKLAEIAQISLEDKIAVRSTITYRKLFISLLKNKTNAEAAITLNISTNALEHILSRNLRKLFITKTKRNTWNNFLNFLLGFKNCARCNDLLPLKAFSKYSKAPDGYSYYCKKCKSVSKQNFTDNNPEYSKNHYLVNKAEYIANAIKYKTRRNLATPPWANLAIIKLIYDCAEGDHVDHIIPLQGELVCGLHVENNLQYLSLKENLSKSNKFITDW